MIEVLVADRSQADFYRTEAMGLALHKHLELKNPAAHLHEIELVSDAPGRTFNRMAGIHQSYGERHSVRDYATYEFVRSVASKLTAVLNESDDCIGIYLIASPKLLGQIRKAMPPAVRDQVLGELPKDLRRCAASALSKRLLAARHHLQWRKGSLASHS